MKFLGRKMHDMTLTDWETKQWKMIDCKNNGHELLKETATFVRLYCMVKYRVANYNGTDNYKSQPDN